MKTFRYEVRRTGTPARPYDVWRLAESTESGWVVFSSKNEARARKRAAEQQATEAAYLARVPAGELSHE
jgi:hypothetical protein